MEIPPGPFRVAEIRELGPPQGVSKNMPSQTKQLSGYQPTKSRITYSESNQGPWTSPAAAGDELQIYVLFEPKFDLFKMMAGPKAATMKVTGPGPRGNWALSIPLNGMFNGVHTTPLVILPEKEIVQVASPFETVDIKVRLVGTGEAVSGQIVWPSLSPGLKGRAYKGIQLGGSETREFNVPLEGTGGHTESTPLDGTLAFQFVRAGDTVPRQTVPVPFKVVFMPGSFSRDLGNKTCNSVHLDNLGLTVEAKGRMGLALRVWGAAYVARFKVFFRDAGRTCLYTQIPADLNTGQILMKMVENGNWALFGHVGDHVFLEGNYSPATLDVYRSLARSAVELQCW